MFENGICHALEIHIFGIIASIAYLLKVLALILQFLETIDHFH